MSQQSFSSIVLITSHTHIQSNFEEIKNFFNALDVSQKDLIIYSPEIISDYTNIKKIPADEVIILYKKDFLFFNLFLKSSSLQTLKSRKYDILIHFNTEKTTPNTLLIANNLSANIKISCSIEHSKKFSLIINTQQNFFNEVLNYLNKLSF